MTAEEWPALLDRLEADADRILAAAPGTADDTDLRPWTPPATPLPPDLADRARAVIERQHTAMERARADRPGRAGGAVRLVPSTRQPDAPAYLDVNG